MNFLGSDIILKSLVLAGCTFAVAPQFSASKFWKECYESNARYTAYIGEMMRYILQQPPGEYDKKVCFKKI